MHKFNVRLSITSIFLATSLLFSSSQASFSATETPVRQNGFAENPLTVQKSEPGDIIAAPDRQDGDEATSPSIVSGERFHVAEGKASYYANRFHGRRTASGKHFDKREFTAAHPSLPFGTKVIVTNLSNGRNVVVTINDRGPHAKGRIIDVSQAAAKELGIVGSGVGKVRIEAYN